MNNSASQTSSPVETVSSSNSPSASEAPRLAAPKQVTLRAFLIGLLLCVGLSYLNAWVEITANVHFIGGTHMPFGAIFLLLVMILCINGPLRAMQRNAVIGKVLPPFSPVELLTIYAMLVFAALMSTAGADNFFLTTGPGLFYFQSPINGWASTFYQYVPSWFAPGWNGQTYQKQVIEPLFLGGLSFNQIPWHAWTVMLTAWSIFLLLIYSTLFFVALLLRRQWIEYEALTFPLIQLPLQMVDVDSRDAYPPARGFWANRTMWGGAGFAFAIHLLRGMNNFYPDWPVITSFHGNTFGVSLPDAPWNVVGWVPAEFFLGAIGVAFLLTSEVSLSFWFFYLVQAFALVMAQQFGFAVASLPKDSYQGKPIFIAFQSVGGWIALALMMLWSARRHLLGWWREAFGANRTHEGEPFSPRFVVAGFTLSFIGLLVWSAFAGINIVIALSFFALYILLSLVLARLVIEGGFLFPQTTFSPLEWMSTGVFGSATMGAATITKLSFVQPMLTGDMRTNVLPAFMHTLKIAHELKMERSAVRRLLGCVVAAIVVSMAVSTVCTIATLYSSGGLKAYSWFTQDGPKSFLSGAANLITTQPSVSFVNVFWVGVGAAVVVAMTMARSRFLWFSLHPLGYIIASGYPLTRLWFSFFIGWLVKSLLLKFGGQDSVMRVRPFMIGLILGNAVAMVFWMAFGIYKGSQIGFWPA